MLRPTPDLACVLGAAALAVAFGVTSAAGLALAWAVAWLAVNAGWPRGPEAPRVSGRAALVAALLVALLGGRALAAVARGVWREERLVGLGTHLEDRLAREASPSIDPLLWAADRPQTFFVEAEGARAVALELAGLRVEGEALGRGLFRVELDPRAAGPSAEDLAGERVAVTIVADGARSELTLRVHPPASRPGWLRTSPSGDAVCAASEERDEVWVVRARGAPTRHEVLDGPTDCAFLDEGRLVVSHRYAGALGVVDLRAGTTRAVPGATLAAGLAVASGGTRIALVHDGAPPEAQLLDGAGQVLARGALEGRPDAVVLDAEGALVVAVRRPASIVRLVEDGGRLVPSATRRLRAPAVHLAARDGGTRVVFGTTDFDEAARPHLGNHYIEDQLVTLDARTLAVEARVRTGRRTERQDHAGDTDRGGSPMGLFATADGALLVAFAGTGEVALLGPDGSARHVVDVAALGAHAPHGVAALAGGAWVVSSPSDGALVRVDPRTSAHETFALEDSDAALLAARPERLRARLGERLFYASTRSGVACQSCHLHGEGDGIAHNIGGRFLAPTLETHGLTGTSPYLRDGSYPRVRDLHEVAVEEYRGYRAPGADPGLTIEGFVERLPGPPSLALARPRDAAQEREGHLVFERAGCGACHRGAAFTDLALHSLAEVFPDARAPRDYVAVDTPSLRGAWARAPYLFDGRAETLRDVVTTANASDRHGHTAGLDADALDALLAFLESL